MAVFSIPGNIKQMFLPFVLNPSNELTKTTYKEAKDVTGTPLIFSFRNTKLTNDSVGSTGKINICPQSFYDKMSDDISFKLLYDKTREKSIDINTIFDSIPGIQIREFLPDTRLDQALDFFGKVISNVVDLFKADKKAADDANKEKTEKQALIDDGIIEKITRTCKFAVKYLTGFTALNLYTDSFKSVKISSAVKDVESLTTYIYKFPYAMWYQLQSCTTTNIYELPCITESKEMYSSDGNPGWPSAGLSLTNLFITGIPVIGPMVKQLLGNVNISFMPWWDAKEGNATPTPPVTVKFDLFNDTAENALFNFIFVNTLVPNAKWVQYNLFQHSPHLYDIKLEGYGRLYACSGQFKVIQQGVLRDMPDSWIDNYLKSRINSNCMNVSDFVSILKTQKLIKIPDVYHVEMTFTSLLPDTFNNYLFTYSQNANITTEYKNTSRTDSVATKLLSDGIGSMATKVKGVWEGSLNEEGEEKK